MHPRGLHALSAASIGRLPRLASRLTTPECHRRPFRTSAPLSKRPNGENHASDGGGAPSPANKDEEPAAPILTAPEARRSRSLGAASRFRSNRSSNLEALPPVKLDPSFFEENVLLYEEDSWESAFASFIHPSLHGRDNPRFQISHQFHFLEYIWGLPGEVPESEADAETRVLFRSLCERALDWVSLDEPIRREDLVEHLDKIERGGIIFADLALAMTLDLCLASDSQLPPLPRASLASSLGFRTAMELFYHHHYALEHRLGFDSAEDMQSIVQNFVSRGMPPRLFLPWLNYDVSSNVKAALAAEFSLRPPPKTRSCQVRRPITLVTIPNTKAKICGRALASAVALENEADVISLDAATLSATVGEYIGQDLAFSRGPISNVGFQVAELAGRLGSPAARSKPAVGGVADRDPEAGSLSGLEASLTESTDNRLFERELEKIKEQVDDYVLSSSDRWENLKINAALKKLVLSNQEKVKSSHSSAPRRKVVVHIDDFVELSMTLEGALLVQRLRHIVDGMWQAGRQIVVLATSTFEGPSKQFEKALENIVDEECHLSCPVDFGGRWGGWPRRPGSPAPIQGRAYDRVAYRRELEARDFEEANARNIRQMVRAISPQSLHRLDFRMQGFRSISKAESGSANPPGQSMSSIQASHQSIAPLPVIYDISRQLVAEAQKQADHLPSILVRDTVEQLMRRHYPHDIEHATHQQPEHTDRLQRARERPTVEPETQLDLDEHESKIISGLVKSGDIKTTFEDIHVPTETVAALKLLTSLSLLRPDALSYGILSKERMPGCLLYGPPGTGKTLLAKAIAKESGANFLEVSGASVNNKWVGESEKNIRAIFSLAKKMTPMVVFIDEADSLLGSRSAFRMHPSRQETLNQLLKEWDGLKDTSAFIMVATNRPYDLDDAVLRRLPRKMLVDLPLLDDRVSILRIHLEDEQLDETVSLEDLAKKTPFYSGSDLKNLCVAAAMAAVQEENQAALHHAGPEPYKYPNRRTLRVGHFEKALKEVGSSVSEDAATLKAIRKFDEMYGSSNPNAKVKTMGFGVIPPATDSESARVRKPASV